MAKNFDGHVRIDADEKAMLDKSGMGFTRMFRIGLDTYKLWIQSGACPSCVYLYNTGKSHAPPDAALLTPRPASAQACPCPACPIRAAFGHVPHEKIGQKENQSGLVADDPISCS